VGLLVALFYALGAGLAHYLDHGIRWATFAIGLAWVLAIVATSATLPTLFQPADAGQPAQPTGDTEGAARPPRRRLALVLFLAVLSVALIPALGTQAALDPTAWLFLAATIFLSLAYTMPPWRLASTDFGELALTVLLGVLIPGFGFTVLSGQLHRLWVFFTVPLIPLVLAALMAWHLPRYGDGSRTAGHFIMARIGWQNGITVHNLLVLSAFLLLAASSFTGVPWYVAWPSLLGLPFGIFEIYLLLQIASGAPPNWRMLRAAAIAMVAITVYSLAFTLWTH
jgi:1,4-dihydroxy-2-naphthoate octaprenyltransferase